MSEDTLIAKSYPGTCVQVLMGHREGWPTGKGAEDFAEEIIKSILRGSTPRVEFRVIPSKHHPEGLPVWDIQPTTKL
jgi:hypothetical protein